MFLGKAGMRVTSTAPTGLRAAELLEIAASGPLQNWRQPVICCVNVGQLIFCLPIPLPVSYSRWIRHSRWFVGRGNGQISGCSGGPGAALVQISFLAPQGEGESYEEGYQFHCR